MTRHLPGLEIADLETYLDRTLPGLRGGPLQAELIPGGRSNLTYRVSDGRRTWVVRRPPLGHVLATAHDMAREHRVLRALQDSAVPVPRVVALCQDESVIGAPFYVMDHVHGVPLRDAADLERRGAARTTALCEAMIDTLAEIHAVDPAHVGLEDFGRPAGFVGRQVHRWKRQLDQSRSRPLRHAEKLYAALAAGVPADSAAAIVHGDFRLDNLLVDDDDQVTAVLDWEMASLGDPLTDLALLLVYQTLASWPGAQHVSDAPRASGYLSAPDLVARYAEATGEEPSHLGFHYALACFKLGAILEGIHYRSTQGLTVGEESSGLEAHVERLFEAGCSALANSHRGVAALQLGHEGT